jgi:hypothetical protein
MLGKLFAAGQATIKQESVCVCVCVCVCVYVGVYVPEDGWSGSRARPWDKEVLTSASSSCFVQDSPRHITGDKTCLYAPPHKPVQISVLTFYIITDDITEWLTDWLCGRLNGAKSLRRQQLLSHSRYGIKRFITLFIRACHWFLFSAR